MPLAVPRIDLLSSFSLTPDMVTNVYLAAFQLRVETIFKACSNYLAEQLNEHNCLSTRLMAVDDELRTKATECIQTNFFAVLETREFHTLPSVKLELIGRMFARISSHPPRPIRFDQSSSQSDV